MKRALMACGQYPTVLSDNHNMELVFSDQTDCEALLQSSHPRLPLGSKVLVFAFQSELVLHHQSEQKAVHRGHDPHIHYIEYSFELLQLHNGV